MPVPAPGFGEEAFDLSPALPWFPLIGAVVGALGGALRVALEPLVGRGPSTVIAIAALVVVTGGLHQDALADMFDGLGVRGDRERRLAVMRDSTLGAFGVLALILWTLLLFTSLQRLTAVDALRTLIAAGATGRVAVLGHGLLAPPARADGLGASLRVTARSTATATLLGAVIAIAAVGLGRGGLAIGVAAVLAVLSAAVARSAVGGSTGDTLGASVALAELGVCLALIPTWQ